LSGFSDCITTINNIISEKAKEAFLVGGVIRDIILEREFRDADIVISGRAAETARYFAEQIEGSFVVLDEDRDIYRVVKDNLLFDFAMMAGNDILEDLGRRDFTINSMALPLGAAWKGIYKKCSREGFSLDIKGRINRYLLDPFGGFKDIKARKIRANKNNVFIEDPLRLWRAVRLSEELSFSIDDYTAELMKRDRFLACRPAPERIRDELMKIFELKKTAGVIKNMEEEFGLLSCIIPEIEEMKKSGQNKYHQESAWEHSLQVLDELEKLMDNKRYSKLLDEKSKVLLKISALLHDIGKIETRSIRDGEIHYYGHDIKGAEMLGLILKKLRFKRSEISFIRKLVKYHMRPMNLYIAERLTEKGKYRFFQQAGIMVPFVLIHSLADKTAAMKANERLAEIAGYQDFIGHLFELYEIYRKRIKHILLSGKDIMDLLKIEEGPYIGQLLEKLTIAQGRGEIRSREEAIAFLKKIHS
jgi:poly(A) polymerase